MKKWFPLLAVVLILVLTAGFCVGSYYLPVMTADCIVRVAYRGNMQWLVEPFEYYAICGTEAVRVSEQVVEQLAPEAISGSRYGDVSSTEWFAHLYHAHRASYFGAKDFLERNDPWLPTDFGETYRVYYHHWHGAERMPDEKEQQILVNTAQQMHSGDINDFSSAGGPARGLTWYILVSHGEQKLVQLKEEALYRPMEDGTFAHLMDCPAGGQFDYFWFP